MILRGRKRLLLMGAVSVLLAGVLVVFSGSWGLDPTAWLEGPGRLIGGLLRRHGPIGAVGFLYMEESGVPMPVPGDFFVMYLGHHAPNLVWGIVAWLGIICVVILGSTNLYLISRRWGRRLAESRIGAAAHLTPRRLARAEGWFWRWGPWALVVGRHLPGFRVPITVAAGTFKTDYRVFVLCVGASTATWAAFFLVLGHVFGDRAQAFLDLHQPATPIVFAALIGLGVLYFLVRLLRARGHTEMPASRS